MRTFTLSPYLSFSSCLIMLCFGIDHAIIAQKSDFEYSSTVIVKIPELTGEQYYQLSSALTKDQQFNLEYVCLESGIIVLKYYHNFPEEGDVQMAVHTALTRHSTLEKPEFVYVDILRSGTAEC